MSDWVALAAADGCSTAAEVKAYAEARGHDLGLAEIRRAMRSATTDSPLLEALAAVPAADRWVQNGPVLTDAGRQRVPLGSMQSGKWVVEVPDVTAEALAPYGLVVADIRMGLDWQTVADPWQEVAA